jgi:hypothetical protein
MTRRDFISKTAQTAALITAGPLIARAAGEAVGDSFVSEPREITDSTTGRKVIQLTSGDCFDMPMYYFNPTFGRDDRTIVFYRYKPQTGEIQLYKINVDTGVTTRLTNATTQNSLWRPYMQPPGFGVRDLQSSINHVTNEAMYFDTNDIHAVNLDTFADRIVGQVPEGRVPSGLTGVSPDGKHFCYPHFDRKWWELQLAPHTVPPERYLPRDTKLIAIDLTSGKPTDLMQVNFWITHSHFYDKSRILFCHTATDYAILMTDLRYPGQYENIRTHSADGVPNHFGITNRGIMYEMSATEGVPDDTTEPEKKGNTPPMAGIYNPETRQRREYQLGITTKRMHIGRDPQARLWFYETGVPGGHGIVYFPELQAGRINPGMPLIGPSFDTYGVNQRSHFHPSVTPDRKYILFTGGDSRNKTNHLFLVDVSDLKDTARETNV